MPVTAQDILNTFASVLPADVLAKIDPALPLVAQGVDSLALTGLALAIQNTFSIKITAEDSMILKSVNDVVALINSKA